ncbi:MAG: hypothetical protein ACRYGR_02320 [Janthinobacterium lividum]
MSPPLDGGSYFDPKPLAPYIKSPPTDRALCRDDRLLDDALRDMRRIAEDLYPAMVLPSVEACLDGLFDHVVPMLGMLEAAKAEMVAEAVRRDEATP